MLLVFLGALFAMLDLSLAALRNNSLSECARRAAREAIVRGERAPSSLGQLGPAAWSGTAADDHPLAEAMRPLLTTMQPAEVQIEAAWPDGSCNEGDRVEVVLRYDHQRLLPLVWGSGPQRLTATSRMQIVH